MVDILRAMTLAVTEQRLCDRIASRGSELLRDLAAHVAIPTGHDHQPGLARYRDLLAARLKSLGAGVEILTGRPRPRWLGPELADDSSFTPPVLVARTVANSATPGVLIVGHMDTVHDPRGSFQTLSVSSDGRIASGPGAVDMKGGIVIALAALEALAAEGVELAWTLALNSDEETGSFSSDSVLRALAREHEVGLVLEPALPGGALAIERMGSGQFMIEVFGRAAHVGRDFAKGVSAVHELGRIIAKAADLAKPQSGRIVNVGPLRGGSATNIVADYAACWGNVRYADAAAGEALARALEALGTPGDELPRVAVHRGWNRPAKPLTPGTEQLALAARAVAEDLGQSLPFEKTGGVCDGNNLQDEGLPVIDTLGVRGGNLHRTDEFVEVASLIERCQLLAVLMARLAGGAVRIKPAAAAARRGSKRR
jgi:glutamate carboxypeptidase